MSNKVFSYQASENAWIFAEINRCIDLITETSFFEKVSDVQVQETNYKSLDCAGNHLSQEIITVQFDEPVAKYRVDFFG